MKKIMILLAMFTILFSLTGCQKKEPLDDIIDKCALSFARSFLVNNFDYNPDTRYYLSERIYWMEQTDEEKFPCYYFVYETENILFCVGIYSSEKNDTGLITYPYMGEFIYSSLVDEATTLKLQEDNRGSIKNSINKEISLSGIKNIDINKDSKTEEISLKIKESLTVLSEKRIGKIKYTEQDKFYIKYPIRDYTIIVEDRKNISINEKLIYPLFMNDTIIALYEFDSNGNLACTQKAGQESIYAKAYQTSDKFILVHGGNYPYLKTYCLFADEQLDAETISEMLKDPIFIRTKKEIDQLMTDLKPYDILLEIELNGT